MTLQLTPHFSYSEFIDSATADAHSIRNIPNAQQDRAINYLAHKMELIRGFLEEPITITSGFRSPELNQLVGGSPSSAHLHGMAVDFICPGFGSPDQIVRELLRYKDLLWWDQLICEDNRWVHIGFNGVKNRGETLRMAKDSFGKAHYTEFA